MSEVYKISPKRYMAPLVIETKLNRPYIGENLVLRKRLLEKLNKSISYKLTLVTAPAGFGKSTLMAQWASENTMPTTWLSLNKTDNDTVVFWSYFIHALKDIHPQLGSSSLDLLHSPGQQLIEKGLAILINEINRHNKDFFIILDDFHVISDAAVYNSLEYLLDYLPPCFHICIVSRTRPALPLAALKAKNHLLELPLDELRFSLKENELFFQKKLHGLSLSEDYLLPLHQRLEGWVAGMQMLSMLINNCPKKADYFINNLVGGQRYFTDYFIEEILDHQPVALKRFLLQTSVLRRMNASLCNALTGDANGQEVLERLEQMNLFIIPLDEERCWYRYHHLFAGTLKSLIKKGEQEDFLRLHQKAGIWFKENGFNSEAIYHALEGRHYQTAAAWIEEEAPRTFKAGKLATLAYWIRTLPEEMLWRRPKIRLYYIWILIISGKTEEAELSLKEMMDFLGDAGRLSLMEDRSSLDFISDETGIIRGYLALLLEKPKGAEIYMEAIKKIQPHSLAEVITLNPDSASLLQTTKSRHGKIKEVFEFYKATEPAIKKIGDLPSFSFGYVVLSEIYYEMGEWKEAQKYIETALSVGKTKVDSGVLIPAYITAAKIKMRQGEPHAALELLGSLEKKVRERAHLHWLSIIEACKTRIAIESADQEGVCRWLECCELSVNDEITVLQYYQFATLVRALLFLQKPAEALHLADRMAVLLQEGGGIGQQIEILILKALCCQALHMTDRALSCLAQAIKLGSAEGYYRMFIDEGKELFTLLKTVKAQQLLLSAKKPCGQLQEYMDTVYAGFIKDNRDYAAVDSDFPLDTLEPLTPREQEVVELLAMGLSNKAIAENLYISVVTVKTHVQSIFQKLKVNSRAKAIARINDLHLRQRLDPSD